MKKLLTIAGLVLAMTASAHADPLDFHDNRLAPGKWLTIHTRTNPDNRDLYGCYECKNAVEAESLRGYNYWDGRDEVAEYVRQHDLDHTIHDDRDYWKDTCMSLASYPVGGDIKYKIADVKFYRNIQFICLEPEIHNIDVGSPNDKRREPEKNASPDRPICFWTT
ncbi:MULTISPECIES: hypothetical protein [unclassified Bradyrhizobium]|uniref:hypothetical protein n=1 Tax=unclassified Bradyrhizobium TaxID=2631580 RepID=UPI00041FEABC|nr:MULTISPECIES: hypothetical protein [unclassified Bradyrhizobium]MCP3465653.1 hypothetical protein [Bradyrhizobium sp. CCGUVB23]